MFDAEAVIKDSILIRSIPDLEDQEYAVRGNETVIHPTLACLKSLGVPPLSAATYPVSHSVESNCRIQSPAMTHGR